MFFLEFAMKFQKNLVFFDVLGSNSKKTSSFPKFQNSKKKYQLAQIFLEFWNFGKLEVFWNFGKFQKAQGCFEILLENLSKPCVFWESAMKFKKTLGVLMFWDQIPKKSLGFLGMFQNSK